MRICGVWSSGKRAYGRRKDLEANVDSRGLEWVQGEQRNCLTRRTSDLSGTGRGGSPSRRWRRRPRGQRHPGNMGSQHSEALSRPGRSELNDIQQIWCPRGSGRIWGWQRPGPGCGVRGTLKRGHAVGGWGTHSLGRGERWDSG